MTTVITTPTKPINVSLTPPAKVNVGVQTTPGVDVSIGTIGPTGPMGPVGPVGPEGGTPVVALAYDNWPPVNPKPNTLYLRLAP